MVRIAFNDFAVYLDTKENQFYYEPPWDSPPYVFEKIKTCNTNSTYVFVKSLSYNLKEDPALGPAYHNVEKNDKGRIYVLRRLNQ